MFGWDITDYGFGKFYEVGFTLITVYNSTEDGQFADTDEAVHCDGRASVLLGEVSSCAMMMKMIIVFKILSEDFRRLRKMNQYIISLATNIRK